MRPKSIVVAVAVALCIAFGGCTREQRAMFGNLYDTQKALAKQFPDADVNVMLSNDRYVIVTVVNSKLNAAGDAARAAQAKKAALTAASMMTTTRTLKQVRVTYIKRRGGWGVTLTESVGSYAFPINDLIVTRTP